MSGELRYERVGAAAVLTIDRPRAPQRGRRRHRARVPRRGCDDFEADDGARVLVLTGAGGEAFCAGADLKAMDLDVDHPDGPMGPTRLTPSKPAIAAVDGWCLAGGVELALWCDLRIATPRLDLRPLRAPLGRAAGRRRHPAPAPRRRHGPGAGADPHRPAGRGRGGAPDRPRQRGGRARPAPRAGARAGRADRRLPAGDDARRPPRRDRGLRPAARRGPRAGGTRSAARCSRSPSAAPPASPPARAATGPSRLRR